MSTPFDGSTRPFQIGLKPLDPRRWTAPGAQLGGCTVLGQVSVIAQHRAQKGRKIAQESLQRGPTKRTFTRFMKTGSGFIGPGLSLDADCCI